MTTTTTDEVTHLRALLADEHAKRCAAELDHAGAEAERDAALAACAEMRAALEGWHGPPNPEHSVDYCPTCALLSRPDLGAGMVMVPRGLLRETVNEARQLLIDHYFDAVAPSPFEQRLLADLDALLKKGGG